MKKHLSDEMKIIVLRVWLRSCLEDVIEKQWMAPADGVFSSAIREVLEQTKDEE